MFQRCFQGKVTKCFNIKIAQFCVDFKKCFQDVLGTLQETLGAAMCEISLRNVVSIFTGRGAVESLLNSGGRKIKLWGEDRSGRAKCEMRGVGTRGGNNGTDTE